MNETMWATLGKILTGWFLCSLIHFAVVIKIFIDHFDEGETQ